MEWLWSELFLGHKEPCAVPVKVAPVSHPEAMQSLTDRFSGSVDKHLGSARRLSESGSCVCGDVSGSISSGAHISGSVSGVPCTCGNGTSGSISGGISSGVSGMSTTTTTAAVFATPMKVVGKMEVELVLQAVLNKTTVEAMFKTAIAKAVNVSVENVVKLNVLAISASSRRLQPAQNTSAKYEVSYEITVPSSYNATEVVMRANRIAVNGSSESQLFQQSLTDTSGVVLVGSIVQKEPATAVEIQSTNVTTYEEQTETEKESRWKALAIGGAAVLGGLICLVICVITSIILFVRHRGTADQDAESSFKDDAVIENAV